MNPSNGNEGEGPVPEEPTSAAFVKITTTPEGATFTGSVPEKEAGRMLEVTEFVCGLAGTVIGPYAMANAFELAGAGLPWQVRAVLLTLATLLPAACYLVAIRRRRR